MGLWIAHSRMGRGWGPSRNSSRTEKDGRTCSQIESVQENILAVEHGEQHLDSFARRDARSAGLEQWA